MNMNKELRDDGTASQGDDVEQRREGLLVGEVSKKGRRSEVFYSLFVRLHC